MLLAKLDKRISRVSIKLGKKFQRLEWLNGEPIHCNLPLGIPKWAVDASSIQSTSDGVLSNGQVIEADPMADLEPTEQSEAVVSVVESEGSDSDFTLDLS